MQVETFETLNAVIFPFSKANYCAHTLTYVSGALLWSTDIAGFGSTTQGVTPKVKSCLSNWRDRERESETEPNREQRKRYNQSRAKPKAKKFKEC